MESQPQNTEFRINPESFTHVTYLSRMYFTILINCTSPFSILGLLGGIFHFYSNFKGDFCFVCLI